MSLADPAPSMGAFQLLCPLLAPLLTTSVSVLTLPAPFLVGMALLRLMWNFNGFIGKQQISPKWLR